MTTAAPTSQFRYSRNRGGALRLARRSSHQAVRPLRTRPLISAQAAMPMRNSVRWTITNAEALTARMPTGVMTPRPRRTSSLSRRLVPAAASLRGACVVTGVERVTAGARVHCVGVVHREAGAHQAVDVVDLRATDVVDAEVVDQDLDALVVDHEVVLAALVVEGHAVLHPGATAAGNEDAESQPGVGFLGEQVLEARLGFRS